jgi:hypothetical protein
MNKQTPGVKALLKELEVGKKQLKAEYEKSMSALDAAIKVLQITHLDATEMVSAIGVKKGPGRPKKGSVNLKALVKKVRGKGKRGRPAGASAAYKGNLTQTIYDTVVAKKRFVHNRDIVDTLMKKFPKVDRADFSKKISVLLASLKKQGRLVTYNDGGYRKSMYWGVKEWMTPEGRMSRGKEFAK